MTDLTTSGATRRHEVLTGREWRRRYSEADKPRWSPRRCDRARVRPGFARRPGCIRSSSTPGDGTPDVASSRCGMRTCRCSRRAWRSRRRPPPPVWMPRASGLVLVLGDLRLSFGPNVAAERVAATIAALRPVHDSALGAGPVYAPRSPSTSARGSTGWRRWPRRSCGSIRSPGSCSCSGPSARSG